MIYCPAIVNIVVFGLYSPSARAEFDLVRTSAGWVNISGNGIFDWYFYMYYIVFSLACILLLWTWNRVKFDINIKRTVTLISLSFAIGMSIGSITDVLFRLFMQDTKPQLGVIFAIIPVGTVFYTVKRYGLMMNQTRKHTIEPGKILTERTRLLFYRFLSIAYIAASLFILLEYFIYKETFSTIVFISSIIFFIGLCITTIPHLSFSVNIQDRMVSLMVAITVPLVLLRYINHSASNIIWSAPFLIMILASIFNQRLMLILIVVSASFTQLWIWSMHPEQVVTVASTEHVSRLIIFLVAAVMVYYINRIYQRRLQENEEQTNIQRLMSQISAALVSVNVENLDDKINWILQLNGEFFAVDRTYLFQSSEDLLTTTYTHEWCTQDIAPAIKRIGSLPTESFPWWMAHMNAHQPLYITDVKCMPKEAQSERELLEAQQVKSLISVPVISKGRVIGFLGFDSVKSPKVWRESHQEVLQIMANVVSDALVKVNAEKEISYMAYYDGLTGLSNRALFNNQLEKAISLAGRSEKLIGILFLDLDSFKAVNDTMGHEAGDMLLKEISRRLSHSVRRYDTVCRFGGDEFLVMFPQIDTQEQIEQAGDKLMSVFEDPVILKGQEFYITASAGVAVYPIDGEDVETLIKSADLAMYTSKDHGKNQVTFCSPIMKEAVKEKMQLTNDLYRALEREELLLYYQPQVQIDTGKIIGLEALIRWQHPERDMVPPIKFISLAEQTGLIHPIGEWVLKTACRQNKAWQDMGLASVVMAVNLSVEQFRTPHLTEVVAKALRESGLSPEYLELEITEGIAIKESDYIIPILNNLKEQGVAISIDNFGTAYSSLSRLKELPIDRLKMAMEFVQGIDKGTKDKAIVMVIINLAKSLGLRVIAEGVETEGQLAFLTKGICDEVQGYYFHRPMPAADVQKIMQKG